jgi:hypothetical protein
MEHTALPGPVAKQGSKEALIVIVLAVSTDARSHQTPIASLFKKFSF